jgi:hypothetical protein
MSLTCGQEIREYGRRDPSSLPRGSLYEQKSALTLLTIGGRSVGIVRSRTEATELLFYYLIKKDFTPWNQDSFI